jgi:hypothetical protein
VKAFSHTKLINHHSAILHIPSTLLYNSHLKETGMEDILNLKESWNDCNQIGKFFERHSKQPKALDEL